MRQAYHIFNREMRSFFVSPIAYIVIAIFLLVTGWFFFSTFFLYNQASMRGFFSLLPVILSFVIPAVTMKLFSEEFNRGSYEMLMTLPVNRLEVVKKVVDEFIDERPNDRIGLVGFGGIALAAMLAERFALAGPANAASRNLLSSGSRQASTPRTMGRIREMPPSSRTNVRRSSSAT